MSFLEAKSWKDVFTINKVDAPAGATHGRFVHPTKGNLILHLAIKEAEVMYRNDYPPSLVPMSWIIKNSWWLVDYKVTWYKKIVSYEEI